MLPFLTIFAVLILWEVNLEDFCARVHPGSKREIGEYFRARIKEVEGEAEGVAGCIFYYSTTRLKNTLYIPHW